MNSFVNGNNANAEAAEYETVETKLVIFFCNFERSTFWENLTSHDLVIEKDNTDRIRKVVTSVDTAVESRVHDVNLTAKDSEVIPRVEMAVRSFTRS